MSDTSMNPDIKTAKYGVRSLKEVTIYPLSIADQLKATEIISDVLISFSTIDTKEDMADTEVISFAVKVVKNNLEKILSLVTETEVPFDDLTNNQLNDIVNIIFSVNYEGIIKNFQDLFGKMTVLLNSKRS